jgi:hypothetical protein
MAMTKRDHITSAQSTAVAIVGWCLLALIEGGLSLMTVFNIALGAVTLYTLLFWWLRGVQHLFPFLRDL